MALIGMPDAGRRLGVAPDSARRALVNAAVPLVRINARAWAVDESDLQVFINRRAGYKGRGRPRHRQPNPEERQAV